MVLPQMIDFYVKMEVLEVHVGFLKIVWGLKRILKLYKSIWGRVLK